MAYTMKTKPTLLAAGIVLTALANGFGATRYVNVNSASPTPPFTNWATAATTIQAAIDAAVAGDEIVVTNGVYATGGRPLSGGLLTNRVTVDKPLIVRSVNGPSVTMIQGLQVPGTTNGLGDSAVRGVYLTNGAALMGFTVVNGATRQFFPENSGGGVFCERSDPNGFSAIISNCVLASSAACCGGGTYWGTLINCVIATNSAGFGGGVYNGSLSNCVLAYNSAEWAGGGTYRGALDDCTLTGNLSRRGGGAFGSSLNDCRIIGNSAEDGGGCVADYYDGDGGHNVLKVNHCTFTGNSATDEGGGAFGGIFNNCVLTGNSAGWAGGAVSHGTLNNCTLTGNSAVVHGGACFSTLTSCIVYFNTALSEPNYDFLDSTLGHCCTTPWPGGFGNFTNEPGLVNYAGGDLRLQSNSPCINAGLNSFALGLTDRDGNPRFVSGTVDIGAYEFQGPGSVISYAWLQQYGLPTDGSADFTDPDADGHNTWQEWRCQTDPTNALSSLRLFTPSRAGSNVTVSWQSVPGVTYFLERGTNPAATTSFRVLATNLYGQLGATTVFTDTNGASAPRQFYRVGIQE